MPRERLSLSSSEAGTCPLEDAVDYCFSRVGGQLELPHAVNLLAERLPAPLDPFNAYQDGFDQITSCWSAWREGPRNHI